MTTTLMLLLLIFLSITATTVAVNDTVACNEQLELTCTPDHVIAAEIYASKMSSGGSCDTCRSVSRDSMDKPMFLLVHIAQCRWTRSSCTFTFSHFGLPCLVAKQFQCVHRSDIYDICSGDSSIFSPLELPNQSAYIKSPGYPQTFPSGLSCVGRLRLPPGKSVNIRIISADLPVSCDLDYLHVTSDAGDDTRICNVTDYSTDRTLVVSGTSVHFGFFSRPEQKHYEGFVLHYEVIDSPVTTRRTEPPSYTHISVSAASAASRSHSTWFVKAYLIVFIMAMLIS